MSNYSFFDYDWFDDDSFYGERQARREANHRAYLERQARREERHQAYLERQERREANRRAYFERITKNVMRFRDQYVQILEEIRNQGLDSFVKSEVDDISLKLQQIDQLLSSDDIEAARDLSFEIGQLIHGLLSKARRVKQNPSLYESNQLKSGNAFEILKNKKENRQKFIEQLKQNLELDVRSNSKAVQEAVNRLDNFQRETESLSDSEFRDRLISESDHVDGEIVDESVRRAVIKSIFGALKKAGFIVENPLMTHGMVLLRARKPAGQQAEFKVNLEGHLSFKFDQYEGQKCKQDIDKVTALLEECYGVKLSNQKVLWSNPDRIQQGSRDNPTGGMSRTSDC